MLPQEFNNVLSELGSHLGIIDEVAVLGSGAVIPAANGQKNLATGRLESSDLLVEF